MFTIGARCPMAQISASHITLQTHTTPRPAHLKTTHPPIETQAPAIRSLETGLCAVLHTIVQFPLAEGIELVT
jgi:hypothetical protein